MSQTRNKIPRLTIRNRAPGAISSGANTEVFIDGQKINGIRFLKVEIKPAKIAKVTMEVYADIEMDLDSVPETKEVDLEKGENYQIGAFGPVAIK